MVGEGGRTIVDEVAELPSVLRTMMAGADAHTAWQMYAAHILDTLDKTPERPAQARETTPVVQERKTGDAVEARTTTSRTNRAQLTQQAIGSPERILAASEIVDDSVIRLMPGERVWLEGFRAKRRLNKVLSRHGYVRRHTTRDETGHYSEWTKGDAVYRVYHRLHGTTRYRRALVRIS